MSDGGRERGATAQIRFSAFSIKLIHLILVWLGMA
jgi:hypothetical protein